MMTHILSVAALVLGVAAFGVLAPATAKPAAACSMGPMTLEQGAEIADLVIVGEVISERSVSSSVYESTIAVAATLKGRSAPELTLDELGFLGADCSGGPRLAAGERVLLFLYSGRGQLQVTGYEGGKYVLSKTEAVSAWQDKAIAVEDALQRVAVIADPAPGQVDAALAFASGEPAPNPTPQVEAVPAVTETDDAPSALLIGLAAAGGTVLLAALLFAIRRLRRENWAP